MTIFFILSCVGSKSTLKVENNIFSSSYPKINIKVDPDLTYVMPFSSQGATSGEVSIGISQKNQLFYLTEDGKIKKALIISMASMNLGGAEMQKTLGGLQKDSLQFGKFRINNLTFNYFIHLPLCKTHHGQIVF